jgi:hypothetical protein
VCSKFEEERTKPRRCSTEFGTDGIWGADYGGVAHREECDALPEPLKGGCYWRFDWFRNAGMCLMSHQMKILTG